MPELVDFLTSPASDPLDELVRLARRGRARRAAATDERMRELLESALPLVALLLDRMSFLSDYQLAVPDGDGAETWMGVRREQRPRRSLARRDLPPGRPVAARLDRARRWWRCGRSCRSHAPAPGEPPTRCSSSRVGVVAGRAWWRCRSASSTTTRSCGTRSGGMLDDTSERDSEAAGEEACPFPGLSPFTAAEAASFFGREREIEAFVNRLRVTPLLAVVGPSGAGKSSFVQAGVLPGAARGLAVGDRPARAGAAGQPDRARCRRSAPPRSRWPAASRTLAERAGQRAAGGGGGAQDGPSCWWSISSRSSSRCATTPAERERYAEALVGVARSPDDPVRVVLTLRDDFLLRAEALPALRARLGPALQLL